jgi:hypothetical protein
MKGKLVGPEYLTYAVRKTHRLILIIDNKRPLVGAYSTLKP